MKPALKIGFAPEWSYKTSEKELAIGVYICALRSAYSKAETKAKELEDYDSSKDSWLDMEITDDDGNTEVARTWIKQKAEEQCLQYLVIENELKSTGLLRQAGPGCSGEVRRFA